ncbi:MAG: ATP-grasp domain-containing protein [Magnetococcus sp. DMHC-8]
MSRRQLIDAINARLGNKKLIWLGTRGQDAQPLLELACFEEVFSVAAPLGSLSIRQEHCLEEMCGRRPNLDNYTLDSDLSPQAIKLRRLLHQSLGEPSYLAAYRPHHLLSAVCYPRSEYVTYLGLFSERHAPFEHKPWVETELRRFGVPVIPWKYYADDHIALLMEDLRARKELVLRASRTDGGFGISRVNRDENMLDKLPPHNDGFFAAAPVLLPHIPLNVGACLFPDGHVTLHGPSVQLIGLPGCTNRPFGYCGNDFSAYANLETAHQQELEQIVRRTGQWLSKQGYLGAFGVDAILYQGQILVVEINPRFQGSSRQSAIIDRQFDRPDIYLCHIASFLGIDAPKMMPIDNKILTKVCRSHIVVHNIHDVDIYPRLSALMPEEMERIELLPGDGVSVATEAIVCRIVRHGSVTQDGWTLESGTRALVERITGVDP